MGQPDSDLTEGSDKGNRKRQYGDDPAEQICLLVVPGRRRRWLRRLVDHSPRSLR
jgi:hypothetical protein